MPTNRYISPSDLDAVWVIAGKIIAGAPEDLSDVEVSFFARRRELETGKLHPQTGILRDFNPDLPALGESLVRYSAARTEAANVIDRILDRPLSGDVQAYLKQAKAALVYVRSGEHTFSVDMAVNTGRAFLDYMHADSSLRPGAKL